MNKTKVIPAWVGDLLLFLTAVVWGGGFIGVQKSLDTLSPFYMIATRFAIGSLLMVIIFWKRLKGIKKQDILIGSLVGTFLFIGFAGQTMGAMYLSVGKLAFLTALNVILVPFLVFIVFKEKIKSYNVIASLIAIIGFGFLNITKDTGFNMGVGELITLGGTIGFAAHITALGHYSKKVDPIVLAVMQMITCALLGTLFGLLFEKPPTEISMQMIWPVAYLGVFSTFIAFLCQTVGQKYTSASRAAIILCMESVFGIIFSVILLKEIVTTNMMIGATLILFSVIVAEYMHVRSTKNT